MGIRSEKNYEDAVNRWTSKGDEEWAKAKNGDGGEHYKKASDNYANAKRNQEKLDDLRKK
ncbi:MAG: hypothetical protein ACK5JH_10045 [Anaerocolumna sp.]